MPSWTRIPLLRWWHSDVCSVQWDFCLLFIICIWLERSCENYIFLYITNNDEMMISFLNIARDQKNRQYKAKHLS